MKRAVLHIGTEKTGTTSIQRFLLNNVQTLSDKGYLFPSSCEYLSNRNLVIYAKQDVPNGYLGSQLDFSDGKENWNSEFVSLHKKEVKEFQADGYVDPTVIYSSEHLQSRLTKKDEIVRVFEILLSLIHI